MFAERNKCDSQFLQCVSVWEPAEVVQEVYSDGECEQVLKPIKKVRKNKYLPGVKLLKKLNKDRLKKKR